MYAGNIYKKQLLLCYTFLSKKSFVSIHFFRISLIYNPSACTCISTTPCNGSILLSSNGTPICDTAIVFFDVAVTHSMRLEHCAGDRMPHTFFIIPRGNCLYCLPCCRYCLLKLILPAAIVFIILPAARGCSYFASLKRSALPYDCRGSCWL